MLRVITTAAAILMPSIVLAQAPTPPSQTTFALMVEEKFNPCLSADGATPPQATAVVKRGPLNDTLTLNVQGLKPGLQFDLFTVQRTNLTSEGALDPNFGGSFGLAWYQSDVNADSYGNAQVVIQTILLDQIFGFDGDLNPNPPTGTTATAIVAPIQTLHVGFWFNNPADPQACGFDVTKPTPFNGQHMAGPAAMLTVPDPKTGLGPLCTQPSSETAGATCIAE